MDADDEEFLSYCWYHSRTDRHLFSAWDAHRLQALAGEPPHPGLPAQKVDPRMMVGMDNDFVDPRVERARDWLAWSKLNPVVATVVSECHRERA